MRQAIELPLSKKQLINIENQYEYKGKELGGRPKLASYQKRTKCFRVMFTENDYIYIQSKAEQAGLSVNEFCHQAAMDCQVCQRISPEMVSAIRDLSGIANNVNQIAHQMHIYGLETVKQQCFSIVSEVSRIITQVKNTCHDSED
ncbi:MobC family plasmid mobilization relaxosome protein [Bacteroides pyogenes]|uniref:MobC family plasmid mobilization relaxosome protein n=1 Tax=Bacteroides pyogenes TaxID=310300 RepID=UPI000E18037E|nr:mobilization protein BmgB [Bacteroides pyogenes]